MDELLFKRLTEIAEIGLEPIDGAMQVIEQEYEITITDYFMQIHYIGPKKGEAGLFKFHISVDPEHIVKAWDLIVLYHHGGKNLGS